MENEIKKEQAAVRSFRVTDDVMARFKGLQEDLRLTQDGALKLLVDAYELEQAKNAIPDRETEIANFQVKASELVEAFLHSLQLNQDAEARIRAEFQRQLDMKDKTIENYQKQIETEQEKAAALAETQMQLIQLQVEAGEIRAKLTAREEEIVLINESHAKQTADKDSINTMLTEKLAAAEKKAAGYDELQVSYNALVSELNATKSSLVEQQREYEVKAERAAMAAEKATADAVRAAEKEADKAIKAAQSDYIEAQKELRKMEVEKAELREKLVKIEAENAALRERLLAAEKATAQKLKGE